MAPSRWRQLLLCVSCLWHRSEDGSGWVLLAALSSGTPSSSITSHAEETLVPCHCFSCSGLGHTPTSSWLCVCWSPRLPTAGTSPPTALSSLPHCHVVGALELGGCGHTGHQDRSQMGETRDNHVCDGELLIPVTMAGGAWGVCPHGPQLDLPGSSTSSPWLVVGMKRALLPGQSSCPSGDGKAPCAGDMGTCPTGPAGRSSPTAAGDATTAKRCHFLQLGFYRVGGRGAFIELCLHFWSFLRDTFSHERPAWSHLLRGGL